MDNLRLCSHCGDQYTTSGSGLCGSCAQQAAIDKSDWTPVMCPECHGSLCIQNDWTKPIYDCEMCGHHFTDPDGEWIDLCEKCGYVRGENHKCDPNYRF